MQTLTPARLKNILAVKIRLKNGQKLIILSTKEPNRSAVEVLILDLGAQMRKRKRKQTQEMLNIVFEVFNLQLLLWSRRYRCLRSSPICSLRGPVTINRCGSRAAGDNANALVGSDQSLIWDSYSFLEESLRPGETLQKERELNGQDWWYVWGHGLRSPSLGVDVEVFDSPSAMSLDSMCGCFVFVFLCSFKSGWPFSNY